MGWENNSGGGVEEGGSVHPSPCVSTTLAAYCLHAIAPPLLCIVSSCSYPFPPVPSISICAAETDGERAAGVLVNLFDGVPPGQLAGWLRLSQQQSTEEARAAFPRVFSLSPTSPQLPPLSYSHLSFHRQFLSHLSLHPQPLSSLPAPSTLSY